MRYFEQARADDTGRYWAVRVESSALIVHQGEFGSPGQEVVEPCGSDADAQKEVATRIAAQIRSGFREICKTQNPREGQQRQKRAEYRNGLEELVLIEERMLELIREERLAPSRAGLDGLLNRYTDVVAADAQLLRGFLKRQGTTSDADPDPDLWREIKDEMHSLVPVIMILKLGEPSAKQTVDALTKFEVVFAARTVRTNARMVPKMYLALSAGDLMDLGRRLRSRCRLASATVDKGVAAPRVRA